MMIENSNEPSSNKTPARLDEIGVQARTDDPNGPISLSFPDTMDPVEIDEIVTYVAQVYKKHSDDQPVVTKREEMEGDLPRIPNIPSNKD